jgi:hypothetical protein
VGDDAADTAGSDEKDLVHGNEARRGGGKTGGWQGIPGESGVPAFEPAWRIPKSCKVRGRGFDRENARKCAKFETAQRPLDSLHFRFRVHSRSFAVKNPGRRGQRGAKFPDNF